MKKCKTVVVEQEEVYSYQCDDCGVNYKVDDDILQMQEMVHIEGVGGYCSAVGDGVAYSVTLCSNCLVNRLGDILQVEEAR